MKRLFHAVKWIFFVWYLLPMSVIGTLMLYEIALPYLPESKPETRILEPVPNGFVYDKGAKFEERVIRDAEGNLVVHSAVGTFKWKGRTIYGKRYGLSELEVYYFVCDYGQDCLKGQNHERHDFLKILEQRGLPGFEEITSFEVFYNGRLY